MLTQGLVVRRADRFRRQWTRKKRMIWYMQGYMMNGPQTVQDGSQDRSYLHRDLKQGRLSVSWVRVRSPCQGQLTVWIEMQLAAAPETCGPEFSESGQSLVSTCLWGLRLRVPGLSLAPCMQDHPPPNKKSVIYERQRCCSLAVRLSPVGPNSSGAS